MSADQIISYVSLGVSVVSIIIGLVNHRRVRSSCCGRVCEVSLDIEKTTPLLTNGTSFFKSVKGGSDENKKNVSFTHPENEP